MVIVKTRETPAREHFTRSVVDWRVVCGIFTWEIPASVDRVLRITNLSQTIEYSLRERLVKPSWAVAQAAGVFGRIPAGMQRGVHYCGCWAWLNYTAGDGTQPSPCQPPPGCPAKSRHWQVVRNWDRPFPTILICAFWTATPFIYSGARLAAMMVGRASRH